jgi:cupin fold WbuC family metalloprotein
MNYNFHDGPESKAQRLLNALERGTVLPIHRHRHTDETYVLLRGKIVVLFYDDSGAQTGEFRLDPLAGNYGVHIPKGVWHSLVVVEPAVIFEVKDGPYAPIAPEDMME